MTAGPLAGTTLKLRPWQKRFIKAVYRTDKAGNRLVRTAVLCVARKNGKTQLAAALCLCALSGPEAEPRGECYAVACTRFQAGRVFNETVAIITKTPWLNERINIVRFRKELEDQVNGSTFAVLSADVAPVHGLSARVCLLRRAGPSAEPRPLRRVGHGARWQGAAVDDGDLHAGASDDGAYVRIG